MEVGRSLGSSSCSRDEQAMRDSAHFTGGKLRRSCPRIMKGGAASWVRALTTAPFSIVVGPGQLTQVSTRITGTVVKTQVFRTPSPRD